MEPSPAVDGPGGGRAIASGAEGGFSGGNLEDARFGIWDWLSEPVPEMAVIIEESEVQ
ncbi:hypothetical protein Csa_001074 [Cucumis sativus]|uniref:Uncharacterized protein n=1 Tax=Cucumis sativus TaxID=3659 RepID=A0A0A0L9B8_CUCSA|nr:hypothetical protein Csa_001074 [Cucumis sativus]